MTPSAPSELLRRFKGRRVFLTGDTGFKGSWLALWLHDLGAEVFGFSLPPERRSDLFVRLGLAKLIAHRDGDIRNAGLLRKKMRAFKPEFVFHLAAQALVRRSYEDPMETFGTNVAGSVNVLEAVRDCPSVKALVYVTSDKSYRNKGLARGYREEDELGGADPYSASKAAAELAFGCYQDSFFRSRRGFGAASARAGNVLGGGDWARDRIVPDVVRALSAGGTIILRNPSATRPWQHVLDPLLGYLMLAARLAETPKRYAGAWNFGPDPSKARSVIELARGIAARWSAGKPRIAVKPSRLHEARALALDSSKSRRQLGWEPRWDFDRTVSETALWYRAAAAGEDALALTRAQIRSFID